VHQSFVRRLSDNQIDAEDFLQKYYAKLLGAKAKYDPSRGNIRAFVYSSMDNFYKKSLQHRYAHKNTTVSNASPITERTNTGATPLNETMDDAVIKLLEKLSPDDRRVAALIVIDGWTIQELKQNKLSTQSNTERIRDLMRLLLLEGIEEYEGSKQV